MWRFLCFVLEQLVGPWPQNKCPIQRICDLVTTKILSTPMRRVPFGKWAKMTRAFCFSLPNLVPGIFSYSNTAAAGKVISSITPWLSGLCFTKPCKKCINHQLFHSSHSVEKHGWLFCWVLTQRAIQVATTQNFFSLFHQLTSIIAVNGSCYCR